jgi:hypothetical protein
LSKYIIVKYKSGALSHNQFGLEQVLFNIAPTNIESKVVVTKSKLTDHLYIGVLNPINIFDEKGKVTIGQTGFNKTVLKNELLPDGSYAEVLYNENEISFYCDRFESQTLWYYYDDEKLIISNSQRAIISIKKSFFINKKAISWFLSSGSLGYINAWDSQITKVLNSFKYTFVFSEWKIQKAKAKYFIQDLNFVSEKEFDNIFVKITKENFLNAAKNTSISSVLLPLSGGNDSRLLHSISIKENDLSEVKLINWGTVNKSNFNDKVAALKIARHYDSEIIDAILPHSVSDLDSLFEIFVQNSDCRIDQFNAYSDHFNIFKKLFEDNNKIIVRGDIPFTEGIDLNNEMSRAHIGILSFKDYTNHKQYDLNDWTVIQENDSLDISKRPGESLIEWRDRLYIDYRIPIVISAFNDIVNAYIETRLPMMSYSHYSLYNKLNNKQKGSKKHIVRLSKQLDKTNIPFNALPSIPSINELLYSSKNIEYLTKYIEKMENNLFSSDLLFQVKNELNKLNIFENNKKNKLSLKQHLKNVLAEKLPDNLKAYLKSKIKRTLDPLTLAYRIVLIDKVNRKFTSDSKQHL